MYFDMTVTKNDFSKENAQILSEKPLNGFHIWRWEKLNDSTYHWNHLSSLIEAIQNENELNMYALGGFVGRTPLDSSWCKLSDLVEASKILIVENFTYIKSNSEASFSLETPNSMFEEAS